MTEIAKQPNNADQDSLGTERSGISFGGTCRAIAEMARVAAAPIVAIVGLAGCQNTHHKEVIYVGGPNHGGHTRPINNRPLSEVDQSKVVAKSLGIDSGLYITSKGISHQFAQSYGMEIITGGRGGSSFTARLQIDGRPVEVDMDKVLKWSADVEKELGGKGTTGVFVKFSGEVVDQSGTSVGRVPSCPTLTTSSQYLDIGSLQSNDNSRRVSAYDKVSELPGPTRDLMSRFTIEAVVRR